MFVCMCRVGVAVVGKSVVIDLKTISKVRKKIKNTFLAMTKKIKRIMILLLFSTL